MPSGDQDIAFFGRTTYRDHRKVFGIRQADRRHHIYIIGKTGTGKSTLLETLIAQDIRAGRGLALLDPHGDLFERVKAALPAERQPDLINFDAADSDNPVVFNPLDRVPVAKRSLAAAGMLDVFKKLWPDYWGPRMEHILRHAFLALVEQEQATLADILRLIGDRAYRRQAMTRVSNAPVRVFWLHEFEEYSRYFRADSAAPIQNKVGAFLADPRLHRILVQPRSSFDLRDVMDKGRILLVNLAKGRIGEDTAALLGALLVSKIGLAGLSRADVPEDERQDFAVYLDEFHTFTTLSLATMLSELRKYRVSLVMAHQYLGQLEPEVSEAVLGNAGTIISFRLGPSDAQVIARELAPTFAAEDLLRLPNHHVYVKLMIDGAPSRPFSAQTRVALAE